jgi:hypothetical protein
VWRGKREDSSRERMDNGFFSLIYFSGPLRCFVFLGIDTKSSPSGKHDKFVERGRGEGKGKGEGESEGEGEGEVPIILMQSPFLILNLS